MELIPALLISMSIFPCLLTVSSTIFSRSLSDVMSATIRSGLRWFSFSHCLLILVRFSKFLPTNDSVAEDLANDNAHMAPIPELAPVISTTLSVNMARRLAGYWATTWASVHYTQASRQRSISACHCDRNVKLLGPNINFNFLVYLISLNYVTHRYVNSGLCSIEDKETRLGLF